jgi:hypothetical protein
MMTDDDFFLTLVLAGVIVSLFMLLAVFWDAAGNDDENTF